MSDQRKLNQALTEMLDFRAFVQTKDQKTHPFNTVHEALQGAMRLANDASFPVSIFVARNVGTADKPTPRLSNRIVVFNSQDLENVALAFIGAHIMRKSLPKKAQSTAMRQWQNAIRQAQTFDLGLGLGLKRIK